MELKNEDKAPLLTIRSAVEDDYDAIVEVWRSSGLDVRLAGRDRRPSYSEQLQRFPGT